MFLDDAQIERLTRRKRPSAQIKVLRAMGIEHRQRPDGTIAILAAHVEQEFGFTAATAATAAKSERNSEPDFSMI